MQDTFLKQDASGINFGISSELWVEHAGAGAGDHSLLEFDLGLVPWGPEQVRFLRYRPVLSNRRLIEDFGYQPRKSSSQVFEAFLADRSP